MLNAVSRSAVWAVWLYSDSGESENPSEATRQNTGLEIMAFGC